MKIASWLIVPFLFIGGLAVACGGGSKTVNVPGGKVSVGGGVPSDFPSDFPQYKGATVEGSYAGKTEGGITGTYVSWTTGDSVDKVTKFYEDAFKSGSWKSTANGTTSGSSYWMADSSDGKNVAYVVVSGSSGQTSIIAVVGPNDQTPTSGSAESTSTSGSSSGSSGSSGTTPSAGEATAAASQPLPDAVTLSSDFPTDRVPFPSGARVTSDSSFSSNGTKTNVVELYVQDTPANVANYFKNEMPKHSWTDAFSSQSNGQYLLTFSGSSNDGLTITVEQSDTPGYAKVSLSVVISG